MQTLSEFVIWYLQIGAIIGFTSGALGEWGFGSRRWSFRDIMIMTTRWPWVLWYAFKLDRDM